MYIQGTTVIPMIHSCLVDERVFPNTNEFKPERFLDKSGQELRQDLVERVVAFSMGKRQCLGEPLARMELFLIFATLMQKFKFELGPNEKLKTQEQLLKRIVALTARPAPYQLKITARK